MGMISKEYERIVAGQVQIERNLRPPTQEQINQLYQEIYDFMSERLAEANRLNKPCLFVIGETHHTILMKRSLIVEKIFIHVGKQLGIKNLFIENGPQELEFRQRFVPMADTLKADPKKYEKFCNEMQAVTHLLRQKPLINHYHIIPTEPTRGETVAARDRMIADTVASKSQAGAGLLTLGTLHLKAMVESQALNKKFLVIPICTQPQELLSKKALTPAGEAAIDFATNPQKVKQFVVKGQIITTHVDLLLDMVDRAHENFISTHKVSQEPTNKKDTLRKKPEDARLTQSLPSSPISPIAPTGGTKQLDSFTQPTAMLASSVNAVDAVPVCPNETSITSIVQMGFWVASKFGFCANPFYSVVPIVPSDKMPETPQQIREASADQKLKSQGSSLDGSLHYLFGEKYSKGSSEEKNRLKKFVVNVINRDVDRDIGLRFNELAKIGKEYERGKQLFKLLQEAEERAIENYWGLSRG